MKELFKEMRVEVRDAAPRDSWQPDVIAAPRAEGRELSGGRAQGKTGHRRGQRCFGLWKRPTAPLREVVPKQRGHDKPYPDLSLLPSLAAAP